MIKYLGFLAVELWLVEIVQSMYRNFRSCCRVNRTFSDSFLIQVGLHQDLLLGSLSFIIVLEVLSREIRSLYP